MCFWATLALAGIPELSQAQVPLKATYKNLTSESCGETATGGCVTKTYNVVELRNNKVFTYTKSISNCTSGTSGWVRSESRGKKVSYSYQLRGDTIYLKDSKIRFFVLMKEALYANETDFYFQEK